MTHLKSSRDLTPGSLFPPRRGWYKPKGLIESPVPSDPLPGTLFINEGTTDDLKRDLYTLLAIDATYTVLLSATGVPIKGKLTWSKVWDWYYFVPAGEETSKTPDSFHVRMIH